MHIPLVYEHLFYKYFVRRSVGQATKGKRASLLMDVVILVNNIASFLSFCILKIILKIRRTLCIFTTKVELFVLFFSYYPMLIFQGCHDASFHIITIFHYIFSLIFQFCLHIVHCIFLSINIYNTCILFHKYKLISIGFNFWKEKILKIQFFQ